MDWMVADGLLEPVIEWVIWHNQTVVFPTDIRGGGGIPGHCIVAALLGYLTAIV